MKCCRDILNKKDSTAFVCIELTREGQIYGQYPLRRKIRGDKGGADTRARTQMCFGNAHRISRSIPHRRKSQCNMSTSISGRPTRLRPLVTLSSRTCFPPVRACVSPRSRSPALHAGVNSIFPIFPREKKARRCTPPEHDSTAVYIYKTKRRNDGRNQTLFFVVPR